MHDIRGRIDGKITNSSEHRTRDLDVFQGYLYGITGDSRIVSSKINNKNRIFNLQPIGSKRLNGKNALQFNGSLWLIKSHWKKRQKNR